MWCPWSCRSTFFVTASFPSVAFLQSARLAPVVQSWIRIVEPVIGGKNGREGDSRWLLLVDAVPGYQGRVGRDRVLQDGIRRRRNRAHAWSRRQDHARRGEDRQLDADAR